jgi:[acyl-carrier-protein] S-malonyltransferase
MAAAFVFPGQGSQAVGMGKALAEAFPPARAVFDEGDGALGEKLSTTMWDGAADTLTLTENAQPALMAVSLAVMRVLEAEAGVDLRRDAKFVAGHSLGEYSALAAAGALTISDTAKLLRIRGRAMQQAVPVGTGAMAALLALDLSERRGRRIDIEQREMRLAIFADAEVQRLHAPVFVLGDLAAHLLDDAGELLGQIFDLLRADVLARKVDVFV